MNDKYNYDPKTEDDYNQNNQSSALAITSLVLGILSILACFLGPILGIPGVICGHIARKKASRGETGGSGLALGGVITGYLGTILGVIYIAGYLAFLIPAISVAHNRANEIKCQNNLKQIGLAMIMYAEDGYGNFPNYDGAKGLNLLRSTGYIKEPEVFLCPACDTIPAPNGKTLTEETCDYNYKGGLNLGDGNPQIILVWDKKHNHENSGNAVFMDCHIETMRGSNWESNLTNNSKD